MKERHTISALITGVTGYGRDQALLSRIRTGLWALYQECFGWICRINALRKTTSGFLCCVVVGLFFITQ